jgi:23S rRNA (guanine745-N1)-methyltransferase
LEPDDGDKDKATRRRPAPDSQEDSPLPKLNVVSSIPVADLVLERRALASRVKAVATSPRSTGATPPSQPLAPSRLACSVRGCESPLVRREQQLVCAHGHAFDLARSGYWNALQPQDRRSLQAGDSAEAVAARQRLFARGVGGALASALAQLVGELEFPQQPTVLDVGCGPGLFLRALTERRTLTAYGQDLSRHAIEAATKQLPSATWIVANADRRLPFASGSFDLVLSIAGPKNASEFARVLAPRGHAVLVVPAADDLIELREAVLGQGRAIERTSKTLELFAPHFVLAQRCEIRERHELDAQGLHDLLCASYRGARRHEAARAAMLERLEVTSSAEILVLAPR